jgi:hypothetical protein
MSLEVCGSFVTSQVKEKKKQNGGHDGRLKRKDKGRKIVDIRGIHGISSL